MTKNFDETPNEVIILQETGHSTTDSIGITVELSNNCGITYSMAGDAMVVEHAAYSNSRDMYRLFDFIAADIERFNIDRLYCKSCFPLSFAKTLDACFDIDGIVE